MAPDTNSKLKLLFIRFKKPGVKGFVILALQAQKRADLSAVAHLINATETRLGTADQLLKETGCHFGELPPFGKPFGLQLLMDRDLLAEGEVYFNVGDLSTSIAVCPRVIEKLESPLVY